MLSCESGGESSPSFPRSPRCPAIAAAGPRDCLEVRRPTERSPPKLLSGPTLRLRSVYVTADGRGAEETSC